MQLIRSYVLSKSLRNPSDAFPGSLFAYFKPHKSQRVGQRLIAIVYVEANEDSSYLQTFINPVVILAVICACLDELM